VYGRDNLLSFLQSCAVAPAGYVALRNKFIILPYSAIKSSSSSRMKTSSVESSSKSAPSREVVGHPNSRSRLACRTLCLFSYLKIRSNC
jgi:hypothetical protein